MNLNSDRIIRAVRTISKTPGVIVLVVAMGGGCRSAPHPSEGRATDSAAVTVELSDPDPCTDRFQHLWLTISDVKASTSSSSSGSRAAFVDFTPNLTSAPRQLDLLGPVTTCFPPDIGTAPAAAAGDYADLRVSFVLNDESTAVAPAVNECHAAGPRVFNCVVDAGGTLHRLNLPAEAKDGIKISPTQLRCGGVRLRAGEPFEIGIYVNSCASLGNTNPDGSIDMKPIIWGWAQSKATS